MRDLKNSIILGGPGQKHTTQSEQLSRLYETPFVLSTVYIVLLLDLFASEFNQVREHKSTVYLVNMLHPQIYLKSNKQITVDLFHLYWLIVAVHSN